MRRNRILAALAAVMMLVGCTKPVVPTPSPSASATPRMFTVLTTEIPSAFDPAATQTAADAIVALNVFQRLLIVHAGGQELKPDAADCLYTSETVYECTLQKDLEFSNGRKLTAEDVKFSIERAYRLNVTRTSIKLFGALQRVEAVSEDVVRFHLNWPDHDFGYALATPSASIVDRQSYDPDAVSPRNILPTGSGPFTLNSVNENGMTFSKNQTYVGATKPNIAPIRLSFVADSLAAEQAMNDNQVDVVWRSLDTAALGRLSQGTNKTEMKQVGPPESRMQRLIWNPASPSRANAEVRRAIADSLQADRSLTSLVPPRVPGSAPSFKGGGRPTITPVSGARLNLTLAYSTRAPGQGDLARLVRDRIENAAGISVQLKADTNDADLLLTDRPAWVNTAIGWLQPYLDDPLPGSSTKLAELSQKARQITETTARQAVIAEIQQQAAADLTVLPISLSDQSLFVRKDIVLLGDPFGPGRQLGLWSFS